MPDSLCMIAGVSSDVGAVQHAGGVLHRGADSTSVQKAMSGNVEEVKVTPDAACQLLHTSRGSASQTAS